jgi:hypothetical protein
MQSFAFLKERGPDSDRNPQPVAEMNVATAAAPMTAVAMMP